MAMTSRKERLCWLVAAGWMGATYATLSVARTLTDFLRDRHLLTGSIGLLGLALVAALANNLRKFPPGPREVAVLVLAALVIASFLPVLTGPEEALHFVQYGFLGGVVLAALKERRGNGGTLLWLGRSWRPAPWAVLLTVAAGWADEGIQAVLPNRYYDLRDVAFNGVAGLLVVVVAEGRVWARKRDGRPRPEGA
jgi:VanZ family protein